MNAHSVDQEFWGLMQSQAWQWQGHPPRPPGYSREVLVTQWGLENKGLVCAQVVGDWNTWQHIQGRQDWGRVNVPVQRLLVFENAIDPENLLARVVLTAVMAGGMETYPHGWLAFVAMQKVGVVESSMRGFDPVQDEPWSVTKLAMPTTGEYVRETTTKIGRGSQGGAIMTASVKSMEPRNARADG